MKKKYLIIPIILIIITCNVKCFASTNNEIITKEYQNNQKARKKDLK